jgi:hypothetical protein
MTRPLTTELRPLAADERDDAELDQVVTTLSAGFADNPALRWIFPDDDNWAEYSRRYFACWAELGFERGRVWTAGASRGALITFPSETMRGLKRDAGFERRIAAAAGPCAQRAAVFGTAMLVRHPLSPTHSYAAFIGVAPGQRGHGLGAQIREPGSVLSAVIGTERAENLELQLQLRRIGVSLLVGQ